MDVEVNEHVGGDAILNSTGSDSEVPMEFLTITFK